MSTGITVSSQVRNDNGVGSLVIDTGGESFTATQTDKLYSAGTQVLSTTHELLVISADIVTAGIAWFKNIDLTQTIQVGRDVTGTFVSFMSLKPGESYPVRLSTTAIYAKAISGSPSIQFLINAD